MKRPNKIILFIIIAFLCAAAFVSADNVDLVVLLDTSESVFPIFDELLDIVITDSLKNHLQLGDYFHLLSFAGSPQVEVSSQIKSSDEMEDVLSHLLLLQPLGNYTDLLRALQYVYQFTAGLPEARKKKVIILTDGIHDPPPGSPFAYGERDIEKELEEITDQILRRDWDVRIIRLPSPDEKEPSLVSGTAEDSGSGEVPADTESKGENEKENLIEDLSRGLESDIIEYPEEADEGSTNEILGNPSIDTPEDLGTVGRRTTIPIQVKNHDSEVKTVRLLALRYEGENILLNNPEAAIPPGEETVLHAEIRIPEGLRDGNIDLKLIPEFEGDLRFSPNEIDVALEVDESRFSFGRGWSWKYIVLIAAVLLVLFFIFMFIKRMGLSLDSIFKRSNEYAYEKLSKGSSIEMVVEGQNPNIGLRNVHSVSGSRRLCVGGDGSPFVIFLHPFPRCIGEVSGSAESLTFRIRREEHFPEKSDSEISDCLGTPITAVSSNGKKVRFYFRKYISPLDRINKIMRLTSKPGPPDPDD